MSDFFHETIQILTLQCRPFSVLTIAFDSSDNNFIQLYRDQIRKHNKDIQTNMYANCGFDLFTPRGVCFQPTSVTMVNFNVKCEMKDSNGVPSAFYMYPRSSISKTPLMLANSVGIIDAGYRGNLLGAFRSFSSQTYFVDEYTRHLQITNPTLAPIVVQIVNANELSSTERGSGGFGSTGA